MKKTPMIALKSVKTLPRRCWRPTGTSVSGGGPSSASRAAASLLLRPCSVDRVGHRSIDTAERGFNRLRPRMGELKLGLNLGYWGIGPPARRPLEVVQAAERPATTRSGSPSPTAPTSSACSPGWRRRPRRSSSARRSCRSRRAPRQRRRWPGRRSTSSPAGASSSASAPRARRSPRAGTASPTRSPGAAPASTSRSSARSSPARARSSTRASTTSCRCPSGEGKALKLNFHPERNRIPVFLGAIGRKSVELAAEIADGWIPIFFSVDAFEDDLGRAHRGGASQKGGRSREDLEVSPTAPGRDRRRPRHRARRRQGGPAALLRRHGQPQDQLLRRPRPPVRVRRGRRRGPARSTWTESARRPTRRSPTSSSTRPR